MLYTCICSWRPSARVLAAVLVSALLSHGVESAEAAEVRAGVAVADITADVPSAAVRRAAEALVPVRLGVGVGQEDRIAMNRRLDLRDGRSCTIRRANPSPPDASVVGLGPLDSEIGVLRLDRLSGKPLAVVTIMPFMLTAACLTAV